MAFHCYLAKKICIASEDPSNPVYVSQIDWSRSKNHDGYLTVGTNQGSIHLFRFNDQEEKSKPLLTGILTPSEPIAYRNVIKEHFFQDSDARETAQRKAKKYKSPEMHHLSWNNIYYKLTSADNKGLLIVWNCKDGSKTNISFTEEMINRREKCTMSDLSWSLDGSRVIIAYSDGYIMVGGVSGNKEMSLDETTQKITHVCWGSDDNSVILLGTENGEVHAHNAKNGAFIKRVRILCVNKVNYGRSKLVGLRIKHSLLNPQSFNIAICFDSGHFQMSKHYEDANPVCFEVGFRPLDLKFSPNGQYLCLSGSGELAIFETAHGEFLKSISLGKPKISGNQQNLAFDRDSNRIAIGMDDTVYFANIRPNYKYGLLKNSRKFVYCYQNNIACDLDVHRHETISSSSQQLNSKSQEVQVCFTDMKTFDHCVKKVKNFITLESDNQNFVCVLAKNKDRGTVAVLCNSMGNVIANKKLDFVASFLTLTESFIIIASVDRCLFWIRDGENQDNNDNGLENTFNVVLPESPSKLTALTSNNNLGILAFNSPQNGNSILCYSFPEGTKTDSLVINSIKNNDITISLMRINHINSLLGLIDSSNTFHLVDLRKLIVLSEIHNIPNLKLNSTWNFIFATDLFNTVVFNEKNLMQVVHKIDQGEENIVVEKPQVSCNHVLEYKEMTLTCACLDRICRTNPSEKTVEKNLRRLKQIIKEDGLKAACTYANNLTETSKYQNSELTNSTQDLQKNQKIWKLLATEGLKQLDFDSAEKAFVNSRNLYGIRLVKKLRLENNPKLREGYIYSYLGDFEKAKSRFEQADRLDLIINMELKLNRLSMVQVANINSMSSALSDQRQNQCFLKIADNCLMKQDYNQVIAVLGRIRTESLTKDEERLYYRLFVDANVKLARFHELERLAKKLPNDHFMLEPISQLLTNLGFYEQAASILIKSNKIEEAIILTTRYNAWSHLLSMDLPPEKQQLLQDKLTIEADLKIRQGNYLQAGKLYQESGRYKDGALIFFNYADALSEQNNIIMEASLKKMEIENARKNSIQVLMQQRGFEMEDQESFEMVKKEVENDCPIDPVIIEISNKKEISPLILKQLYVLAGILAEKYQQQNKEKSKQVFNKTNNKNKLLASMALDTMLEEEVDAGKDCKRLIEQCWRPAEAYHYYILVFNLLRNNQLIVAQHAAQYLIEYEDILGYDRVYSILLRVAVMTKQMALAKLACQKLKKSKTLSITHRGQVKNMVESIFKIYADVDARPHDNLLTMEDSGGGKLKKTKYPRCIASGRPLTACQFWMCAQCRHSAFEEEITKFSNCPLCYVKVE